MIAHDRDEIVDHNNLANSRNFFGRAVIDMRDLAAKHRALCECRKLHRRQHGVDRVDDLAVGLVGRIQALDRLPDQREILRLLERRVFRHGQRACRVREIAIGCDPAAWLVFHLAAGRRTTRRIDLPLRRSGLHQHGARRRPCNAQRLPERADGIGIARDLNTKNWIAVELVARRGVLEHNLSEIGVELFGQNHRHRGIDALAHLDLRHDQRRLAGMIDADEGIGGKLARSIIRRLLRLVRGAQRQMQGQNQTARETSLDDVAT